MKNKIKYLLVYLILCLVTVNTFSQNVAPISCEKVFTVTKHKIKYTNKYFILFFIFYPFTS